MLNSNYNQKIFQTQQKFEKKLLKPVGSRIPSIEEMDVSTINSTDALKSEAKKSTQITGGIMTK
jgi:hypothetical protein